MKDHLRDPNTLELFPEVVDDLEKTPDVESSEKTKRSKIQNRFRKKLIKDLSSISKCLD
jgi:hypothetical protein